MDYLNLFRQSFEIEKQRECAPRSRLEFLSESIFDFTTYDSEISELFAARAVEVCAVINDGKTFAYILDPDRYRWYLLMCNMPFFYERLEWGSSIRGAWWSPQIEFSSCGLWSEDKQLIETFKFRDDGWRLFISAVIDFAGGN